MITVVAHFLNEERLLPWWLRHHRSMFDHGILIDHGSSDRSVEICKALVPSWKIVKTSLKNFDAIDNDFEVMKIEEGIQDWKVALNISEFLLARDLRQRLSESEARGHMGLMTQGVVMVDTVPDEEPDPERPLVAQKHCGYLEERWRLSIVTRRRVKKKEKGQRGRLIHRYPQGAYLPGRHRTFRYVDEYATDLFTLWYGYSPWTPWFIARKTSFGGRVSPEDHKAQRGLQHLRNPVELQSDYRRHRFVAHDLRSRLGDLVDIAER